MKGGNYYLCVPTTGPALLQVVYINYQSPIPTWKIDISIPILQIKKPKLKPFVTCKI